MKYKAGVTILTTMSRITRLVIAIQLDPWLTESFLMSLIFENSWHILKICCTYLLYGILSFELRLVLKLAAMATSEWTNLFECGMLLLSYLAIAELSDLWFTLVTSIVIDVSSSIYKINAGHAWSWVVTLLWLGSEILTNTLRCVATRLLWIWIVGLNILFCLFLICFFSIMRLNCFHAKVWFLQDKFSLALLLLSSLLLSWDSWWYIERICLIILWYACGQKVRWLLNLTWIYGFSLFIWIEILPILFSTSNSLGRPHR